MDIQQQIQPENAGPKPLKSYLQNSLVVIPVMPIVYPLMSFDVFYHIKDVHPFLIKNGIKMNSPLDYCTYFNNRDGSYRIWSCYWSGLVSFFANSITSKLRLYSLKELQKFKDSSIPDPATGKLPQISAKKAVRYLLSNYVLDFFNALIDVPFDTLWVKMYSDYEPVAQFDHIIDCYCKVVEKDGFAGLFKAFGYALLERIIDSTCDAFLYYNNEPTELTTESRFGEESWLYYGVKVLDLLITYPLRRLKFCRMVDDAADLQFGLGLFHGFIFVEFIMEIELALKFWNSVNK